MPPGVIVVGGVILLMTAVVVLSFRAALGGGAEVQERMQLYALVPDTNPRSGRSPARSRLSWLRLRLNAVMSGLASEKLNLQLTRANWRLTVPEFLMLRMALTIAAFLAGGLLFRSVISGVALAVMAYLIPNIYLRRNVNRRVVAFERQLADVLSLLGGAVRAGYSLLQAIEVVAREVKPPASEEFARVLKEVSLGVRLPVALAHLSTRMQNPDLELMVTAIDIQYQVGGNMAAMLSAVTETIRERMRLFGEVRVITTQQRYTSYLLTALPVFIGAMLFMINPAYMMRLFTPGPLLCIPIGSGLGIILGHLVIQRIVQIEV